MIYSNMFEAVATLNNYFEDLGFVDDYNYLNGESVKLDPDLPYIIVTGYLGIGKSVYSKAMSLYNKDVQYLSVQKLDTLYKIIRVNCLKHIHIMEV